MSNEYKLFDETKESKNDSKQNGHTKPSQKSDIKEHPDNITQTPASLEIQLKSSAELLKQLSSTGHIEHLHLLEEQMKRSMQVIERLKSASNTPKPNQHSFEQDNVDTINKLRTINSMPSNLRELG